MPIKIFKAKCWVCPFFNKNYPAYMVPTCPSESFAVVFDTGIMNPKTLERENWNDVFITFGGLECFNKKDELE